MRLIHRHNSRDFRQLANRRLPGPIFNYIDGGADDEVTMAKVADAIGARFDVTMDSGVKRGTHVPKAPSRGAKAAGIGHGYLYALATAGQPGVERALGLMRAEIERDMELMGVTRIDHLDRQNLRRLAGLCAIDETRRAAA